MPFSTQEGAVRPRSNAPRTAIGRLGVAILVTVVGACSSVGQPQPPGTTNATPPPPAEVTGSFLSAEPRMPLAGCEIYPRDNVFNATVRHLPVRAGSAAMLAGAGGASLSLRPAFTAGIWEGSRGGIPVNVIMPDQTRPTDFMVAGVYEKLSDGRQLGVPMPHNPRFEGWPGRAWDKHMLIVDPTSCTTRELINVQPPGENVWASQFGAWYADAVIATDLASNAMPDGAVTAAGFSLLAGLVRYDEVAGDALNHVMTVTLPEIRAGDPVWPATGNDGRSPRSDLPEMGSWLRLHADADLSQLGPQARVIAEALQVHGAILGDTGASFVLGGEPDHRWDDGDLAGLRQLTLADFDVVDPSAMIVDPETFEIR